MATTRDPLQSASNRDFAKHAFKRMAPGLIAVAGVVTTLLVGATALAPMLAGGAA